MVYGITYVDIMISETVKFLSKYIT